MILLLTQGCSINKRYHNTGLNIQWNWHLKSNTSSSKIGLGNKKQFNKTEIPSKVSNNPIDVKVAEVDELLKPAVENRYTKTQNKTVYQSHKLFTDTSIKVSKITRDPSPTDKKSSSKTSGIAAAITGLVLNSIAFLSGVLIAATVGIGWGSVQGLFWVLWILGCIPLLLFGLVFTIVGAIKMSQASDEPSKKKVILSAASILALLGVLIIFFILVGS
jgi:Flp pilus assembly protein TadB